jgi:hypothetical protein
MINTIKSLTLPKGIAKQETISFDDLREIQRRLLLGQMTEGDKQWIDAILSGIQTGHLA